MANVNISVQDGDLQVHPPRVHIGGFGRDLSITWILAPGAEKWKFSDTPAGIVCEKSPPFPFHAWDGTDPKPDPGPHHYTATGGKVSVPKLYKYSIHLVNDAGEVKDLDPEIMNDPVP